MKKSCCSENWFEFSKINEDKKSLDPSGHLGAGGWLGTAKQKVPYFEIRHYKVTIMQTMQKMQNILKYKKKYFIGKLCSKLYFLDQSDL